MTFQAAEQTIDRRPATRLKGRLFPDNFDLVFAQMMLITSRRTLHALCHKPLSTTALHLTSINKQKLIRIQKHPTKIRQAGLLRKVDELIRLRR